jgi:pimeloyl-ACP methyl ester carboxylesterase
MNRHTLIRDGLSLAWYDRGGPGTPILFQHGLCGDINQTREAVPDTYRLITLECRAHGASEAGNDFSIATFADDIAALITELSLGPVILGGISMGAAIATRLAVHRPDLVRAPRSGPPRLARRHRAPQYAAQCGGRCAARPTATRCRPRRLPRQPHLRSSRQDRARQSRLAHGLLPAHRHRHHRRPAASHRRRRPRYHRTRSGRADHPHSGHRHAHDAIHPWSMAQRLATLIPPAKLVEATPKSIDKPGYLADLHTALAAFSEDI